jgi:hypothetical protein
VEIEGDKLVWSDARRNVPKTVEPSPNLFEAFLTLADAPAETIRYYAQRWGVLGICKHDLPRCHEGGTLAALACPLKEERSTSKSVSGAESLDAWRRYAKKGRSIVDFAARLHLNKTVKEEKLWWGAMGMFSPSCLSDWQAQTALVAASVNGWLATGGVRPTLVWEKSGTSVVLGSPRYPLLKPDGGTFSLASLVHGTTLFPVLAVQLMMTVSRSAGLAICSNCGAAYCPKRRPNPSRRRYCEDCGRNAAWRDAQQTRRAKKRESEARNAAE